MKLKPIFSFLPLLALVFLTGCISRDGFVQTVEVQSFPAGADVYVDDEFVGTTPTKLRLGSLSSHLVRFEKEFFKPSEQVVGPNEAENLPTLRFGVLVDTGYYNKLQPNPVEARMVADLIPDVPAYDSFEEFSTLTAAADQLLKDGSLSPVEHKYITNQLIEFYTGP